MHPDSTTPPEDKAREAEAPSGLPSWTTWQRLDEELPHWCTWTTLADATLSPEGLDAPESPSESASARKKSENGANRGGESFQISGDGYGGADDSNQTSGGLTDGTSGSNEHPHGTFLEDWRTVDDVLDGADDADFTYGDGRPNESVRPDDPGAGSIYRDGQPLEPTRPDDREAGSIHGDGRPLEPIRPDDRDVRSIRGDGQPPDPVRPDDRDVPSVRGDGQPPQPIQTGSEAAENVRGDGHVAPAHEGHDEEEDDHPRVDQIEPWDDLSQYTQVDLPPRRSTSAPVADEGETEENISPLNLRDRVVIMLLFKQLVKVEDVQQARRRWKKQSGRTSKEPLWRILTTDPAFDRETVFAEAAQVYAFKEAQIDKKAAVAFVKKQKDRFADALWDRMSKLRVLPVRQETQANGKEKRLIFISHDPSRPEVNALLRDLSIEVFELQYAPEAEIEALILEAFPKRNEFLDRVSNDEFALDLGTSYDEGTSLIDEDALEAEISRSSLINLFEAALVEAVRQGVSDIHIFPNARKQIEIHFRVDGELECWHREERVHPEALLAVVKDNTHNVDRFERDSAQDGFIQRKVDDTLIRYRVSVLPVANANQEIRSESIVIRVLDDRNVITDLSKLGLLEQARSKFEWAIRQPHGMVILTGPTGSGKTTTLFAAMHQVVTPKVNVLTVEDPVEYVIPGVRQIKLSHKLDLEQALRSILRHDPDVVMVGEMRDRPTADLAIKLANTGHLTFSTLHTNDAPSAISRLFKMGVEPFLIAYAINLIVAQRLLRTLCAHCKRRVERLDEELLLRLGFTPQEIAQAPFFEEGKCECRACGGSGYGGRRAITETMAFTDEIRRKIVLSSEVIDEDGLRRRAIADGMLTLRGSAREIVKQGDTSVEELIRVTAGEH